MIKEKDKSVLFSCSVSVEGTFCCSKVNDSLWFEVYRFYFLFAPHAAKFLRRSTRIHKDGPFYDYRLFIPTRR